MEKNNAIGDMETIKNLINELRQGRELANQLRYHLSSSSSSPATKEFLAHMILSTYEKSITILSSGDAQKKIVLVGSPDSRGVESPNSEDSDHHLKDATQKRKKMVQWNKQVRVSNEVGPEGPLDGFSWRKYGQKDILGAKFPRGYYRCSHKHMQGCLATKQVQRSNQDPAIFKITYRGSHTCTQAPNLNLENSLPKIQEPNDAFGIEQDQQFNDFQVGQELEKVIKQVKRSYEDPTILKLAYRGGHTCTQAPNSDHKNSLTEIQEPNDTLRIEQNQQNSDFKNPQELANVVKGLRVITQDLDVHSQNPNQEYFPSSSATTPEKSEFMTHLVDSSGMFLENFASGANYGFPVSPSFGSANFTSSAENVHEVVSATTSVSNSSTLGYDFPFGNMGLDSDFTFGNPGGFSS